MRQKPDLFWRGLAVVAVAGVFYVGAALRSPATGPGRPIFTPSAQAQVVKPAITSEGIDLIITQDPTGRRLYVWGFEKWDQDHVRLPIFLETVEATDDVR